MKTPAATSSKPKDRLEATIQCVPDRDLVITDPTYLVRRKNGKNDPWIKWLRQFPEFSSNKAITPRACKLGTLPCLVADTIFGDWHCKVRDQGRTDFADFTADSGLVCCIQLGKGQVKRRLAHVSPRCYTVIPDFRGTVSIVHGRGKCWVEGSGVRNGMVLRFTSRQVG